MGNLCVGGDIEYLWCGGGCKNLSGTGIPCGLSDVPVGESGALRAEGGFCAGVSGLRRAMVGMSGAVWAGVCGDVGGALGAGVWGGFPVAS